MSEQIQQAAYVLVVCTEVYERRVLGKEDLGRGLGSTWEGLIITQQLYEEGGRNLRFIPVALDASDERFIPKFLAGSTRYRVDNDRSYEDLFRLITAQPAVVMPSLGPLKAFQPRSWEEDEAAGEITFCETDSPLVLFRGPRSFIIVERIVPEQWATNATCYSYDAVELGATHYHESYERWFDEARFQVQCRKLGVPMGDWGYARPAIQFMVDARHERFQILVTGEIQDWKPEPSLHASIHRPGIVHRPHCPGEYLPLVASGAMRDLAAEASGLLSYLRHDTLDAHFWRHLAQVRRDIRMEIGRRFSSDHAAVRNLEEIIDRYRPDDEMAVRRWLQELIDATHEAASSIREQAEMTRISTESSR